MPVPVLSLEQMRAWERASWDAGRSEQVVIERVGKLIATRLCRLTRPDDRVLILAGKGHNGDDARCAAPHLAGREAELIEVAEPGSVRELLAAALAHPPAWIVDGWFGIGLNRPLGPDWIQLIEQVNASGRPVLAVDVPSGLAAETGVPLGAAIRARVTVTLGAPKAGLLQPTAWDYTGRLEVEPEIGLVPCPFAGERLWTLPEDFADFPASRPIAGHKGGFGHALILAGSRGYHGAAVLAARGAQRARPGLVTLGTSPEVYAPVASQLQAVMVDDWTGALAKRANVSAVLAGPGLAGREVPADFKATVAELWRSAPMPVIVDASALDWLPEGTTSAPAPRVITPHPGEAARLLGCTADHVQSARIDALRALSQRLGGCWVALKGFQTLIGTATGPVWGNSSGDSNLAQGGSGDVLAGFLTGLLAQPAFQAVVGRTLRYAVWQHGAAGDRLSEVSRNWTPEDLAAALGNS